MKSLMGKIDRFCILHPKFGIKNLMLYIVIGNIMVWLFGMMGGSSLYAALAFDAQAAFSKFQLWRLVTFVLVPGNDGIWVLIALYFYYSIGSTLERYWGSGKFTIYYLVGMLVNILYATIMWLVFKFPIPVTATYINLSMFLAFATMFPDAMVLLFFVIPVKMKWLGMLSGALLVVSVIRLLVMGMGLVSILPILGIFNYLLFCGGWLFDYIRPSRIKQKSKTINFKKAAKQYNKEQAKKPYKRKCDVCGRTDTDFPDLEFRFCSQCAGYHCFCIDHINSHIHFKE